MEIESSAFKQEQYLAQEYTCDGADLSPPLYFSGLPNGTVTLALIMEDPDAPHGIFDHWIIWNLPPEIKELEKGFKGTKSSRQGINSFKSTHYRGPCPPKGKAHHYFFKLYALDTALTLPEGSTKEALVAAMQGHILAEAELVGLYQRKL